LGPRRRRFKSCRSDHSFYFKLDLWNLKFTQPNTAGGNPRRPGQFKPQARSSKSPGTGIARALSKLGFCSRSQAKELVQAGRVRLNGRLEKDPEKRVHLTQDQIEVDGRPVRPADKVYLMLNKPRGLVTSAADEQGRDTVYQSLASAGLPWVSPIGRLDKASEGLLLFSNDTAWAEGILAPDCHLEKTYHVQIDCLAEEHLIQRLHAGVTAEGDHLAAKRVRLLRQGTKNCWLEMVLDEGKNRHLRRLLGALEIQVLRLVRVAIGPLHLGPLPKGQVRALSAAEVKMLARPHSAAQ
jgi:23S rRNA pseudouridine2605 synthase